MVETTKFLKELLLHGVVGKHNKSDDLDIRQGTGVFPEPLSGETF